MTSTGSKVLLYRSSDIIFVERQCHERKIRRRSWPALKQSRGGSGTKNGKRLCRFGVNVAMEAKAERRQGRELDWVKS
jgi:hypothetical protein